MNIVGSGSRFSPPSRLSATTPMIWRGCSVANSRITPLPMTSRSFIGIGVLPEPLGHGLVDHHHRGAAPSSRMLKERPRLTGILNTSKKPGDTVIQPPPP